jgi:mRNA-degrading endonuclease toxin of MazEF toxin-antitoxin module
LTHDDLVVTAITSQVPATLAPDEFLISKQELISCGLPKPSILRLSKIVTLYQRLIIKRIGALPQMTMEEVLSRIRQQF